MRGIRLSFQLAQQYDGFYPCETSKAETKIMPTISTPGMLMMSNLPK